MATLRATASQWWNAGLSFFYPEWCQLCSNARATPAQCFVCPACRDSVRLVEPPWCRRCGRPFEGAIEHSFECSNCRDLDLRFTYARSAVLAQEPVLEILHRYKYGRGLWFEPLLAEWLISRAAPVLATESWDCIVPIPLHPVKRREREFNQAERLARRLSKATGLPLRIGWLTRPVFTESQTFLTREQRRANVHRAFAMHHRRPRLNGERVVLVDDVLTTGSTSNACARVLCEAGAAEVCVWTVARGV